MGTVEPLRVKLSHETSFFSGFESFFQRKELENEIKPDLVSKRKHNVGYYSKALNKN